MQESIDYQLSDDLCGQALRPTVLVTPCPQLTAASGSKRLAQVLEASEEVRAGFNADEIWISINIDRDYLRQEQHLTDLINRIMASRPSGLLLRCFQNDIAPVGDRFVIEGFRELTEGLSGAGVEILLPNSGWLGWLSMAWGAFGFSGGLAKSTWYDRMPAPMNSPPRYETIFEGQLLRHVRWPQHQELTRVNGYQPCWCDSCQTMGHAYDPDLAKVHQIRLAHEEGGSLRAVSLNDRLTLVRDRVGTAIEFRDTLGRQLQTRVGAGFLDAWSAALT
jgi:hypothetical protein